MKVISQNQFWYTKVYIFLNKIFTYVSLVDNHMTAAKKTVHL